MSPRLPTVCRAGTGAGARTGTGAGTGTRTGTGAGSRGFTLIEILVAVALMAMLGLILSTATASIMGAIRDTRLMQDHYHTARVALGRIQREIGMAYLSKHQGENRTTKTLFVGKPNSLTFTYMGHRRMVRDARETDEGVVEYKLEREPKTGEHVLVRREKVVVDDSPLKGGRRLVLARGVKKITFSYWDMDKETWQSDWKIEIDRVQEEQKKKDAQAAVATGLTGNAALGKALAEAANQETKHGPEEEWLPARVKIAMTLETEDGELHFETQARIRLMQPLDFKAIGAPKELENALDPYGPFGPAPGNQIMQKLQQQQQQQQQQQPRQP